MPMHISFWILATSTAVEILLLALAIVFFMRLKKSEALVRTLQERQQEFLQRLDFNATLEKEIVGSFEARQKELAILEEKLQQRASEMRRLLDQAENFIQSPQFLRQTILNGIKRGQSVAVLAKATGLSIDEVELIVDQLEI